jgi:hypothetical protein
MPPRADRVESPTVASAPTVSQDTTETKAESVPRWRYITAKVLVVLFALLSVVSVLAGYVRYQALDNSTVKSTAGRLIADEAIRTQVSGSLTDALYNNVDVAAELQKRLPAQTQGLAAPIAGALRQLTNSAAVALLERPRGQAAFVAAVGTAQEQLVRLLNDRGTALRTTNGNVVLNLRPLVIQLGNRVAILGRLTDRLPENGGTQITLMKSGDLRTAQTATHALDITGRFLWIITLLLGAVAVWLAKGRRRKTLRSLALGFIVAGLIVLLVRRVAGHYVVDSLVSAGPTRESVDHAWTILTSLLVDGGRTLVLVGLIALVGLWYAGETRSAVATRRALAPLFARWEIAYGAAVAFILVMLWWGPTVQFRRPQYILVFVILVLLGTWALRRLTTTEHPDAGEIPASRPFSDAWSAIRR